ncbi:helix-turn-helix domain-containing protein [Patescibacteria group bacterium]
MSEKQNWGKGYNIITSAVVEIEKIGLFTKNYTLYVTFANDDKVSIKTSLLDVLGHVNIKWEYVSVSPSKTAVRIPALPESIILTWDMIRRMTDWKFANDVVQKFREQEILIGKRLRTLREERGLTPQETAEKAETDLYRLALIESGTAIKTEMLLKILKAMGCDPADLAEPK